MAILRARKPTWAPIALYGLAGVACVGAIIFFVFTGHAIFSKTHIDSSNAEHIVKLWCAENGLPAAEESAASPDFLYKVVLPNGTPIAVGTATKNRPNYLAFQANVTVSPEHLAILSKLSVEDRQTVLQELQVELARTSAGYSVATVDPTQPIQSVTLMKSVPMETMTEPVFIISLDEMDNIVQLAKNSFVLSVKRHSNSLMAAVPTRQ